MRTIISRKHFRSLMFVIGAGFLVAMAVATWDEIDQYLSNVNWVLFLVAVIIGIADHVVVSLVFQRLMKKYGMSATYSTVMPMYFYGQVSKYIPGKFWNVLFQRTFVDQQGALPLLLLVNVELLFLLIIRNSAIGIALFLFGYQLPLAIVLLVGGALLFEFVGRSRNVVRAFSWAAKKIGRAEVDEDTQPCPPPRFLFLLFYVFASVTFLASSFCIMFAVFGMMPGESYIYIAAMGLAWVIGAIVLVVPAGVGVREAAFVAMAAYSGAELSLATLMSIAVVYRLWHVAQEGGGVLVTFCANSLFRKEKSGNASNQNSISNR